MIYWRWECVANHGQQWNYLLLSPLSRWCIYWMVQIETFDVNVCLTPVWRTLKQATVHNLVISELWCSLPTSFCHPHFATQYLCLVMTHTKMVLIDGQYWVCLLWILCLWYSSTAFANLSLQKPWTKFMSAFSPLLSINSIFQIPYFHTNVINTCTLLPVTVKIWMYSFDIFNHLHMNEINYILLGIN
jgi:hypothetical protein